METIVVATKNSGKAREYAEMLAPKGIEVKTLADFPAFAIDENGQTFEQSLRTREFEDDDPNFTPRISGIIEPN